MNRKLAMLSLVLLAFSLKVGAQEQSAPAAAAQAELEKQQLRATLLEQFNRVLPTTDTPRGLKVNMGDVLFATAKYELQPAAREALAKLSGSCSLTPGCAFR